MKPDHSEAMARTLAEQIIKLIRDSGASLPEAQAALRIAKATAPLMGLRERREIRIG